MPGPSEEGSPPDERPPTVLLLVRHGRTPLTESGRFSGGAGSDPALSEVGRRDAVRVADLLAGRGRNPWLLRALPDAGPVAALVASPLTRARQTAAVVGERLGAAVTTSEAWSEVAFGAWDGLGYDEVADRWPDELRAWRRSPMVAPPGGESLAAHRTRVRAARAGLLAAHPGETVVVVTHTAPVRVLVADALDAGPAALWRTRISPGSLTVIRYWRDAGVEVVTVNHLP